jgi:WD40 repeat protein
MKTVRVLSVLFGMALSSVAYSGDNRGALNLNGHSGDITSLAFSPSGSMLASSSLDKTIRLWSVPDGKLIRTIKGHTGGVHSVAFSPKGAFLVSGGDQVELTVHTWNVATGKLMESLKGHSSIIRLLYFSPDGKILASFASDRTGILRKGKHQVVIGGKRYWDVTAARFSSDGSRIATMSAGGNIHYWDTSTGAILFKSPRNVRGHTTVSISPNLSV